MPQMERKGEIITHDRRGKERAVTQEERKGEILTHDRRGKREQ